MKLVGSIKNKDATEIRGLVAKRRKVMRKRVDRTKKMLEQH